jgi:hypothetical protein
MLITALHSIPGQVPVLTPLECLSVLKVATEWKFDAVRSNVLNQMKAYVMQDPILRIIAAIQYNVSDWLVPGVNALAQREGPLTEEDVDRLDVLQDQRQARQLLLKIHAVRECFRGVTANSRRSYDFTPYIHNIFGLEELPNTDEDQQTAALITDIDHQSSELNLPTIDVQDPVQKRKQVEGSESPRKRARNPESEDPSLLGQPLNNNSEIGADVMNVEIDSHRQPSDQVPGYSTAMTNDPISIHDCERFFTLHLATIKLTF